MLTFVDSHAHIFYDEYRDDLDEVLQRAASAGVSAIVCPGTNLETSRQSVELARRRPEIRAAAGYHPHDASKADVAGLAAIEELCADPLVVAVGEIGLDYHYDFSPREVQREVFRRQIGIARRRGLPVIIHTRESEEDTIAIVRDEIAAEPSWRGRAGAGMPVRGVFHCFSGDEDMARQVIDMGFFISFPGPITFPSKPARPNAMANTASSAPLDRVLLETDSPYLSPHPHRGSRNEPSRIPVIAAKLAELTGKTLEEISAATNRNVEALFGFAPGARP